MKRWQLLSVIAIAAAGLLACNRAAPQAQTEESNLDHVTQGPRLPPQRVAHGISKLEKYQKFPFDVPPHVISPRLQGEFTSFLQGAGGARITDASADVELLIMSDEQYGAFVEKRSAESVYAIEPSHDHGVSISLPTTQDAAARYYAVFRRTTDGKNPVWINADLTVDFGSF